MYSVLIAEDEMLVRMALKNSLPWDKYNMCVIGEAANGKLALDIYKKEMPDIIVTDIKMPVMDGMELIQKVREFDKECKIIILTCLEEFKMAQKAISFGVTDYIIKLTMTLDEMEAVLDRAKQELDQRIVRKDTGSSVRFGRKEEVYRQYLIEKKYSQEEFIQFIQETDSGFSEKNLRVCAVYVDFYRIFVQTPDEKRKAATKQSLLNLMNEIAGKGLGSEVIEKDEENYFMIIREDMEGEKLRGILLQMNEMIRMYFNISASFGVSCAADDYRELPRLYEEAAVALSKRFYRGSGQISEFSNPLLNEDERRDVQQRIENMILQDEKLDEQIKNMLLHKIIIREDSNPEEVKKLLFGLFQFLLLYYNIAEADSLLFGFTKELLGVYECGTIDQTLDLYQQYIQRFFAVKQQMKKMSGEILTVINYIDRYYMQPITLKELAEKVNMNTAYLSSLFKKELQQNFTDYLTYVRIEKSKGLLLGTFKKSYEIAENVGFADYSYFSRTFKRITGMRPNVFRQCLSEMRGGEKDEDDK